MPRLEQAEHPVAEKLAFRRVERRRPARRAATGPDCRAAPAPGRPACARRSIAAGERVAWAGQSDQIQRLSTETDAPAPLSRATGTMRFSRIVRSSKSSVVWNVRRRPSRDRSWAGRCATGRPENETSPLDPTKPQIASIRVVLPAPLGPIRPDERAAVHRQIHVVDRGDAGEVHAQPSHVEQRLAASLPHGAARVRSRLGGARAGAAVLRRGAAEAVPDRGRGS